MKKTLALLLFVASAAAFAQSSTSEVYKNPNCSCCGKWVAHLQGAGFKVKAHDVEDVSLERKRLGMPAQFASCHTASIDGYTIEGHVPADDIRRLLKERPKALGLAVPAMPPGSPGMEAPTPSHYETLLVQTDGNSRVFARH